MLRLEYRIKLIYYSVDMQYISFLITLHNKSTNVYTIGQQMHYNANLLIQSTAPTCFDVCTSSSGSIFCVSKCVVVIYAERSLHSMVVVDKTLK
jgi:hypothetical protein